jgi:hypothetical protein
MGISLFEKTLRDKNREPKAKGLFLLLAASSNIPFPWFATPAGGMEKLQLLK